MDENYDTLEEKKAWELVDKYVDLLLDVGLYRDDVLNNAKACALMCTQEMLSNEITLFVLHPDLKLRHGRMDFYDKVDEEIKKI